MVASCEQCGRRNDNVVKSQKLNPVNWHPTFRRLCLPCRQAEGFQKVDNGRSYQESGRPW